MIYFQNSVGESPCFSEMLGQQSTLSRVWDVPEVIPAQALMQCSCDVGLRAWAGSSKIRLDLEAPFASRNHKWRFLPVRPPVLPSWGGGGGRRHHGRTTRITLSNEPTSGCPPAPPGSLSPAPFFGEPDSSLVVPDSVLFLAAADAASQILAKILRSLESCYSARLCSIAPALNDLKGFKRAREPPGQIS